MRFRNYLLLMCIALSTALALELAVQAGELENPLPQIQRLMDVFSADLRQVDSMTYEGPKNLLTDYSARNDDGSINVVVEIPSGSGSKWEVKQDGKLHWDLKNGKPRIVQYLPYPCDYGMIPHTKAADGDPLDVVILGPAVPRGSIVQAKVIGVMKLTDKGEQDDKIVAVMADTPLANVTSIAQLESEYPGTTDIIRNWFVNYKGPNAMPFGGFGDVNEANEAIAAVIVK